MTKRAPMTFAAMTLALCLPMTAMARTGDPVLLAELDAPGGGTTCCGAAPPVSMTFCLVYGFQDFTASQAAPYVDADLILGAASWHRTRRPTSTSMERAVETTRRSSPS